MINLDIELPNNFLEEEERSGFLVTKEIKELWAIQLDMIKKFDDVCRKHNLKYFFMFGSLIGAARHKGFIPWDDDVDVCMPRDDFEKMCKIARDEFKEPYFFQTDYSDPGCHTYYAKLRNTNTTYILQPEVDCRYTYHQGAFIDVFILDNIPDDEEEFLELSRVAQKARINATRFARFFQGRRLRSRRKVLYLFYPIIYFVKLFVKLFRIPNIPLRKFDKISQKYNNVNTRRWAEIAIDQRYPYDKAWFDEIVYLDFENLKVPCPKHYDEVLNARYGNWHEFVVGTQLHQMAVLDNEKSYKEYIK